MLVSTDMLLRGAICTLIKDDSFPFVFGQGVARDCLPSLISFHSLVCGEDNVGRWHSASEPKFRLAVMVLPGHFATMNMTDSISRVLCAGSRTNHL